jgi:hypothetical protein
VQKPPSLRNNNGSLQARVRIGGRDAFINRLGRWSDPVAVAKAHAIAAQIWSDYQQGVFDRSLMAYQPHINGKDVAAAAIATTPPPADGVPGAITERAPSLIQRCSISSEGA